LCDAAAGTESNAALRSMFSNPAAFDEWEPRWRQRLTQESITSEDRAEQMRRTNPAYIPRNHMVEAALEAATEKQDFQPFEDLLQVLAQPYNERPGLERYATPARPEEYVSKTFCGT
ncbi:MAG: YdiU family protein, partial [Acidobacteriales bacterium]|nr:YdiU family protein [Terriglobales bacterium]